MNERSNQLPISEDEFRYHWDAISKAALELAYRHKTGVLYDAIASYVSLLRSRFEDPRIARIEALCERALAFPHTGEVHVDRILDIIRGGDA